MASCTGAANGQIILEANGGTGQIRYSISDTLSEFFEGDDPNRSPTERPSMIWRLVSTILLFRMNWDVPLRVQWSLKNPCHLLLAWGLPDLKPVWETMMGTSNSRSRAGTAPYYTSVNSLEDQDFVQNDNLRIDNLAGGETYTIFIRDSAGCQTQVIVPVGIGVDIQPDIQIAYGCSGIFPTNTVYIHLQDESMADQLLFTLDVDDINLATTRKGVR